MRALSLLSAPGHRRRMRIRSWCAGPWCSGRIAPACSAFPMRVRAFPLPRHHLITVVSQIPVHARPVPTCGGRRPVGCRPVMPARADDAVLNTRSGEAYAPGAVCQRTGVSAFTDVRGEMEQHITGFHQDEQGDWVAELACGHGQHVRHNPPWSERPWVTTHEQRAQRLGQRLACKRCDDPEPGRDVNRALGSS